MPMGKGRTNQVTDRELEKLIKQYKGVPQNETMRAMLNTFAMEKASNNIANALDRLNKTIAAIYDIDLKE